MSSKFVYLSRSGSDPDFSELLETPVLAFDIEGTGLNMGKHYPISFSLAYNTDSAFYAPVENTFFRELLAQKRLKIAHNSKYDRSMIKKAGVIISDLYDTMIAAHLLERPGLSLAALAESYLGYTIPTYQKPISSMDIMEAANYSCPHSIATLALWSILDAEMKKFKLQHLFWDIEMPLVPVLSDMELNGVMIDTDYLNELGAYFNEKIARLNQALEALSNTKNVNFNSPDQVADIFYNKLRIQPDWKTTDSGRPQVRGKYLESIKNTHPIIPYYLRFKEFQKLKSTYTDSLIEQVVKGRIHGSFNQTRTRTGRLSSSDPNLHNIPVRTEEGKRIRRAFIAPEGKSLVKADADQLELKMIAIYSKDPYLLAAFREGRDIHEETAIRVLGDKKKRAEGKTMNYQLIYLGGNESHRDMFFEAYPQVKEWTNKTCNECRQSLFAKTLFGRIRQIEEYDHLRFGMVDYKKLASGDRESISTIIQGSSAEVVKIGMINVWKDIRDSDIKMLMQVHDELVFEVPDSQLREFIPYLKEALQYNELELPITYTISLGKSWGEMTKWKE